ncbi:MAG: tetratricopeptide repeat protein [Candidatus Omnitrophota bacterium]|nr:MAG: tetratricopeptide repeat protein [Candidatus Omnitrophota bacterium]
MRLFLASTILIFTTAATTLIYHGTQQTDINYYKGHRFFEKKSYAKAREFYKKSLSINPSYKPALRGLAYSYQWTGDFEEAIEIFNKFLSIEPEDYKIMFALAETLAWNKEYEESTAVCKNIINSTGDIKAQILLGQVYIWNKQFDNAKKTLQTVLDKDPGNFQAELLYAKALHYSGEAEKAIEIYKKLLKRKKNKGK